MKVIVCSYPDKRYYAEAIRWNVAKGIKSRLVFLIFIFLAPIAKRQFVTPSHKNLWQVFNENGPTSEITVPNNINLVHLITDEM